MKRILVVDDEFDIREALTVFLEGRGFAVDAVASGEEALQKVRDHRPDLVLMDLMLPGMTGAELLRTLRADPALDGVPMVTMSAVRIPELRPREGVAAFLQKPFTLRLLRQVLDRTLEGAA